MTIKKNSLGKGISDLGITELLSDINTEHRDKLRKLPIDLIQPGKYQPRKDMNYEALKDLASSIREQGIIQPIVVRAISDNNYEIIAGERRWRAAQMAEIHEIPVIIRKISDKAAIAMSLIENIQRENLNAIDEANALQRLIDEFGMSHQETANAVGKSRTTITNLLRLLNLPDEIKQMIEHKDLDMGHARSLLTLEKSLQIKVAQIIIDRDLSVRETEKLVCKLQQPKESIISKKTDQNILNLQKDLANRLGTHISIQHTNKGSGKLIIKYNNLDELEGIIEHVK